MERKMKVIVLMVLIFSASIYGQGMTELVLGSKLSKTLRLGSSQTFYTNFNKGDFALFNLKQRGIDVLVRTYDPNGKLIEEFDSPNASIGNEIILIDAQVGGTYRIEVKPLAENQKEKKGDYDIEFISVHQSAREQLNAALELLYHRDFIPGFAVGIVDREKVIYQKAYGYANFEKKFNYTVETIHSIASVSKTFIGLSLMILVEEGKLSLDTPVNDILPFDVRNPYFPNDPITIRHLANHTSSINEQKFYGQAYMVMDKKIVDKANYGKNFAKELKKASKNKEIPLSEFLEMHLSENGTLFRKKNFNKSKPGENWYYSNTGAALAAYIVELVSGLSYDEFVMKNIIEFLDLKKTNWGFNLKDRSEVSVQYNILKTPLPLRSIITYPDGEMYMSLADLNSYLQSFLNGISGKGILLNKRSYQEMLSVQHEQQFGKFKGRKDGIFWEYRRDGWMGHSGGDIGVSTLMYLDPETNIGLTFTCNVMPLESDSSNAQSKSIWSLLKRYGQMLD